MRTLVSVILILLLSGSCSSFSLKCLFSIFSRRISDQCEYCHEAWSEQDFEALRNGIRQKLFGQHIAQDIVGRLVKNHLLSSSPKKALVLSLHGATGSGKNYLTQITLEHLLHRGMRNIYVKYWNAKMHFSDEKKLHLYQEDVRRTVIDHLKACERSVFIFDEANKLPVGLLDVLAPMVNEHALLDGVDCTKAMYFFLSNTGTAKINDIVAKFNLAGKSRMQIKVGDFQALIQKGAFNEKGGFEKCTLIKKNVVDSYVPFLPLEKSHIKRCIEYYLNIRKCFITIDIIEELADTVSYDTRERLVSFATYGCRGLDDLIKFRVDDECVLRRPRVEL